VHEGNHQKRQQLVQNTHKLINYNAIFTLGVASI
jgi:hypothetical protein